MSERYFLYVMITLILLKSSLDIFRASTDLN